MAGNRHYSTGTIDGPLLSTYIRPYLGIYPSMTKITRFGTVVDTPEYLPLRYRTVPYTMVGVYHTTLGGFPSSIARQPRGRHYRTTRLAELSARMSPTPTSYFFFGTDATPMGHTKSAQALCDIHGRTWCTGSILEPVGAPLWTEIKDAFDSDINI